MILQVKIMYPMTSHDPKGQGMSSECLKVNISLTVLHWELHFASN